MRVEENGQKKQKENSNRKSESKQKNQVNILEQIKTNKKYS